MRISEVFDIAIRAEAETPRVTRYRRMPRLTDSLLGPASDAARQTKCDRNGGHVLTVLDGQIVCTVCPACWRDEGF